MKERRAFASERCPHCHFWLVGVEDLGNWDWFCTACGCQITDDLLIERMRKKADFKEKAQGQWVVFDDRRESRGLGAPQKGNTVTVEQLQVFEKRKGIERQIGWEKGKAFFLPSSKGSKIGLSQNGPITGDSTPNDRAKGPSRRAQRSRTNPSNGVGKMNEKERKLAEEIEKLSIRPQCGKIVRVGQVPNTKKPLYTFWCREFDCTRSMGKDENGLERCSALTFY